jgi:hypothetical protein
MTAQSAYLFKITSRRDPRVWCIVEVLTMQTLHDLHAAIQLAALIEGDVPYTFFMSGQANDEASAYSINRQSRGHGVSRTILLALSLRLNQEFLYVAGDETFVVRLLDLKSDAPAGRYPRVVMRHRSAALHSADDVAAEVEPPHPAPPDRPATALEHRTNAESSDDDGGDDDDDDGGEDGGEEEGEKEEEQDKEEDGEEDREGTEHAIETEDDKEAETEEPEGEHEEEDQENEKDDKESDANENEGEEQAEDEDDDVDAEDEVEQDAANAEANAEVKEESEKESESEGDREESEEPEDSEANSTFAP